MIPLPSSTSTFHCYLEWDDPKSSTSLRPARVAQLSGTKDADSLSDVDGLRCAAGVAVPPVSHDRWTPKRYGFKTLWQCSIALLDSIVWWHVYILCVPFCTFEHVWCFSLAGVSLKYCSSGTAVWQEITRVSWKVSPAQTHLRRGYYTTQYTGVTVH